MSVADLKPFLVAHWPRVKEDLLTDRYQLAEANGIFEDLDGWLRCKLRCVRWRQWKRPRTRVARLMRRGRAQERAWTSAGNGRGPWWNAGASHMNDAFRAGFFAKLGQPSLLMEHRRLNRVS